MFTFPNCTEDSNCKVNHLAPYHNPSESTHYVKSLLLALTSGWKLYLTTQVKKVLTPHISVFQQIINFKSLSLYTFATTV